MEAYWLDAEAGEARWMFDSLDTIKADASQTGGAFALVHFREFEGSGPPLHVHTRFDNGLYVLRGRFTFQVGDDTFAAEAGAWVFVPRDVPRTWRCDSPEGHMLSFTTPAGFEAFYRDAGVALEMGEAPPAMTEPDGAVVGPLAAKVGTSIVGPPIAAM